jgi:hypothetical protein
MLFLHSHHSFQSFMCNNNVLLMSVLRGAWNVTHWRPTDLHYTIRFILHHFFLRQFLQEWNRIVNWGLPVLCFKGNFNLSCIPMQWNFISRTFKGAKINKYHTERKLKYIRDLHKCTDPQNLEFIVDSYFRRLCMKPKYLAMFILCWNTLKCIPCEIWGSHGSEWQWTSQFDVLMAVNDS